MRPSPLTTRSLALGALFALVCAPPVRSQQVRVVASDVRGVTLRLDVPPWDLVAHADGRVEISARGLNSLSREGRPILPCAQALVALPPGASATARVTGGGDEEVREGLPLAIAGRNVMVEDPAGLGKVPGVEPLPAIADGPWPASPVEVGAPFTVRGQRMAAMQLRPFRYDAASGRLWVRHVLEVRVDFGGGAPEQGSGVSPQPASDRHWEPVLRNALVNYEQARPWREVPKGASRRALLDRAATPSGVAANFDEDFPEVRIRVDTTGVYGLPFDDLAAQGYPAGVPVDAVSLHRHEYVYGQVPPYITLEVPIEVDDFNANGVFDSGDQIVAFLPNWTERSGVTSYMQREWGDGDVFYATQVALRPALRMASRPGWRDVTGLTPLPSYPFTQRWERNFTYFPYPVPTDTARVDRFLWTNYELYYVRPDSLRFETNHLDTTRTMTFTTDLLGLNTSAHVVFAQIRSGAARSSMVVDSLVWYGKDPRTIRTTLPGGAVTEGRTNTLALWGKGALAAPDPLTNNIANAGLNFFELAYWRRFRALRGYLDANSADTSGLFQVQATGFPSAAVRVYDVTDGAGPVRLAVDATHITPAAGGGFTLEFQDSAGTGRRRYVVFDSPKYLPPERYSAVTRRQLTSATGEQDYVLIVPEAFLPAVAELKALRESQGLRVQVAPLEAVNDEFNGGRKSRFAIKRYLRHAYENWRIRFAVLVGDGSMDGRHVFNDSGQDWIPVALLPGPVSSGLQGLEMIPCDPWYGWCWDDNPDCDRSATIEPDVWVGRLPVNSLQQAADVVGKLVSYERFGADASWRRRMLLLADDAYSGQTTFGGGTPVNGYCYRGYELVFRTLNQAVQAVIADSAGLSLCEPAVLDLRSYLTEPSLYQATGPLDTCRVGSPSGQARAETILRAGFDPELFQRLNSGVLWWNYQGHANEYVLSHEGFYRNDGGTQDWRNYLNDGRLFLFSAFSCHANAFAQYNEADPTLGPSIGENMVTVPNRGAVASWASTGFEIVPQSYTYHLNVELARALFQSPPHDDEFARGTPDPGARVPLGEVIGLTLLNYLPGVSQYSLERGVGLTYNLLGDPATRLWVGPAQITVTANGQPVISGQPVRLATDSDTLRLEADLVSNVALDIIELDRVGGGASQVVPPADYALTPPFPDTARAGAGGRRYHLSYTTSLGAGSLRFKLRIVDRYGVESSFDVVFEFQTVLVLDGAPLAEGDVVAPDAPVGLVVLSPTPVLPDSFRLTVSGPAGSRLYVVPELVATPARGDGTGRQWLLVWPHPPYADGEYTVRLEAPGNQVATHRFRVRSSFALSAVVAFPNPFDNQLGPRFVFTLTGAAPADVMLRVFTVSGRVIYESRAHGLSAGYHEIPWDGRDAEGGELANGVYFFRLVAHGSQGTSVHEGRLVKLRKPRRVADTAAGAGGP